jgi:hypothetical protein
MLNKNKTGLALGSLFGLLHLVWSVLVYFGWGQSLLNFIFTLHSLTTPVTVIGFDIMRSVGLIIVTSVVGYVFGYVFASIWNKVHK